MRQTKPNVPIARAIPCRIRTYRSVAARVCIQDADDEFQPPTPDRPIEPHPFEPELPTRRCTVTVERGQGVLSPSALAEHEEALQVYRRIARVGNDEDATRR